MVLGNSVNLSIRGVMMRRLWRIWAKALGEKSGVSNQEADLIAVVRTVIIGVNFITCFFIMAGVVHNW